MKGTWIYRRVLPFCLLLSGCSGSGNYCAFPDTRRIDLQPSKMIVLGPTDGQKIETEASECGVDILVADTSLVISRYAGDYYLASINIETFEPNGHCLQKGRGPGEVRDLILVSGSYFNHRGDHAELSYLDATGEWIVVNLFASLSSGHAEILAREKVPKEYRVPGSKVNLGNGLFLGTRYVEGFTRFERSLRREGDEREIPPAMARLNDARVETAGDVSVYNLLGTIIGYNADLGRVVEASSMMNTIHLYDLQGSFARTVYLGKAPDDVRKREEAILQAENPRDFNCATCLQVYRDFFAVQRADGLLVMLDWEGRLLQAIQIQEVPAPLFDIDFVHGRLFTLDNVTGALWCFDLSSYGPLFTSGHRF